MGKCWGHERNSSGPTGWVLGREKQEGDRASCRAWLGASGAGPLRL